MSEHDEQVALFQWAAVNEHRTPELALLRADPMGGLRTKRTAAKLKASGSKAGFPDIFLPVARQGYHGLFIELKVGKNKPTDAQVWWLDRLSEQGYLAVVCYGFEEAKEAIEEYLK